MRVLHVGKFLPPFAGGIEYFLADLLPALERCGTHTAALVHGDRQDPSSHGRGEARLPGCDSAIYRVPCYGRLLYAPVSPSFPFWLARVIREFAPDLLHLHVPNTSAFWALFVPAAKRIPWVLHWHADVVPSQLDRRLAVAYRAYRPLEQRLIKASSAVIVTSPDYLDSSNALAGWKAKCHVIPLGLDPARLGDPTSDALTLANRHWDNAAFRVLVVGRLTYFKGHDTLIRAISDVPGARVVIVGEGERRHSLERLIETLGLANRVDLAGFRGWESADPVLAALFHTCDVVCLPSLERTESFGLVLLEAMRYGKPVVATAVPGSGIGWVVSEGEHGVLVTPGDPAALAQALRDLSNDSARRQRLGQQGGRRLGKRFHIDRVAQAIDALYRQLAAISDSSPDHSDGAAVGNRDHPKPS